MKILDLHLIMCNNGLKTFYPLVVMKITFSCYLLLITKSGFKTGNNWRTNMNPKRKYNNSSLYLSSHISQTTHTFQFATEIIIRCSFLLLSALPFIPCRKIIQ